VFSRSTFCRSTCFTCHSIQTEAGRDSEADATNPNPEESIAEGTILERSKNIVQHHLVFKWTSLAPGEKFSPTVGALNLSELQPSLIRNSIHSVILACHNAGLGVCNVTGDGAGENVKVFAEMSKVDCLQYIDTATMAKFPAIEFEAEKLLAMEHPVTREPVFVLEDMPHVVKRIVNALEMSSNPRSKRKLRWSGNPLNLWMIQNCWEATDGRSLRMQDTKLTMRHFVKDAFSRMKVYLATQVVSDSVVQMIKRALADDEADCHYDDWQYTAIIELAAHVNNLVDIINGRGKKTDDAAAVAPAVASSAAPIDTTGPVYAAPVATAAPGAGAESCHSPARPYVTFELCSFINPDFGTNDVFKAYKFRIIK
jgi:hypothetical protein